MSESRVRENRTHGSMRRREANPDQSAIGRAVRGRLPPTLRSSGPPANRAAAAHAWQGKFFFPRARAGREADIRNSKERRPQARVFDAAGTLADYRWRSSRL